MLFLAWTLSYHNHGQGKRGNWYGVIGQVFLLSFHRPIFAVGPWNSLFFSVNTPPCVHKDNQAGSLPTSKGGRMHELLSIRVGNSLEKGVMEIHRCWMHRSPSSKNTAPCRRPFCQPLTFSEVPYHSDMVPYHSKVLDGESSEQPRSISVNLPIQFLQQGKGMDFIWNFSGFKSFTLGKPMWSYPFSWQKGVKLPKDIHSFQLNDSSQTVIGWSREQDGTSEMRVSWKKQMLYVRKACTVQTP